MSWGVILTSICVLLSVEADPQFFDFFGFPPVHQNQKYGTDYTTRRTKIDTIRTIDGIDSQITWKNTTISFVYEGIEREDARPAKEKRRKQTTILAPPIFNINFLTTTPKTVRKTTKVAASRKHNNNSAINNNENARNVTHSRNNNNNNKRVQITYGSENNNAPAKIVEGSNNNNINKRIQLSYDVPVGDIDLSKTRQNDYYSRPINNIREYYYTERPYYEATTKPYNYNNNIVNENNNYGNTDYYYHTTKNPFANHPGVRPAVIEKGPPITNKPITRPSSTERPRPSHTGRPVTNKPTTRTRRPVPTTTVKTYIVNPLPTDAGALVYPHEDEPPEIIRGLDEDFMSETEKRRFIDNAEKMCDKYKSLTTKHIQAIPLLPSPEPVRVNVSQCTPVTVPLVVGGKVVTINEFPHMALLGWIKLDGPGYSWKCGGSLISDQFILTAAHCSFQERDNTVVTGPPRVAQLGSSYLDDPGALVVRVGAVVRHPKYKFPKSYYDIALLKLVQKITFSEVIKPACLGVPPPVGDPIIATGWGKTELGGDQSLELRSVSLPVWNMERCRELLGTSRKMPTGPSGDSQMCAGEERGGKDTCQGDSGGPAQIQDGCVWRVVAVTSLGRSCGAPNTPGLYALVHRAFIAAQVFGNQRSNRDSDVRDTNNRENHDHRPTTQKYNNINNNGNYDSNRPTTQKYNYDNGNYDSHTSNNKREDVNNNNRPTTQKYNNGFYDSNTSNNKREDYNNNRPTTQKYDNGFYDSHNNNNNKRTSTTTTTENYQGFYREPSTFTNQHNVNKRPNNNYQNSNLNRHNNQQDSNNNKRNGNSNNNHHEPIYSGADSRFSENNNKNQNNSYLSNNYQNNRENSRYERNNNGQDSNSRNNNGDYIRNNNSNRDSSDYNNYNNRRNERFEEGTIWFT